MNIGFVGMGKLGLPVALAVESKGHNVMGYDINPERMQKKAWPFQEVTPDGKPLDTLLQKSNIQFGTLEEVVSFADIIFIAVQTPHEAEYEGITRLPKTRKDFDYTYLEKAVIAVDEILERQGKAKAVAIISTVLPDTFRKRIKPIISEYTKLVYNPSFIAMGEVVRDYLFPEIVLIGVDDVDAGGEIIDFYNTITDAPKYVTNIPTAEVVKVSYNTFLTTKIVVANTIMELCDKTPGADCDAVTDALSLSTRRLISTEYLRGGQGDGGGCHPRDNIALSWYAREVGLSFDLYDALMKAREAHAGYLADLMMQFNLPKVIVGPAFKKGTNIETGSAVLLCKSIMEERGCIVEVVGNYPKNTTPMFKKDRPAVFLIGPNNDEYKSYVFPNGSVVIDPWGYMPPQAGVTLIKVGRDDNTKYSTRVIK